jgi:predicted esterase
LERAPARAAGGAEGAGDAISEPAPEQSLLAGGDPRKRYFLYGPRTGLRTGPADAGAADRPARGPHPLLLVLPGGDGSADFRPFVTNIWREAAPDDMLVAQLVAPRWSAGQFDAVVWPTEGLGWDAARFTTEAFVEAVVDDVAARYDVDRERVWLLAWSSGGPAAYASLVRGPATGAFVAMSVFRPEHVGDLAGAAGTRVHILHSPGDFIAMNFPERARDMLAAAGATTRLETYSGGHGWHGDVFGMIRRGLRWLGEDEEPPGAAGAVEVDRDQ